MKEFIIILLILLNAMYWGHTLVTWNETKENGVIGKCICGVILLLFSFVLIGIL